LLDFERNNANLRISILYIENCCFDIHCVLVTQVYDQKMQRQLIVVGFFSYKPTVVNYHWSYFNLLLVFLGSIESQKSNCAIYLLLIGVMLKFVK